jgi:hypothetical protein
VVFGEEREDRVRECVAVATSWGLFGWKCRQKGLFRCTFGCNKLGITSL